MPLHSRFCKDISAAAASLLLMFCALQWSGPVEAARTQEAKRTIDDLSFFTLRYGPDRSGTLCTNTVPVLRHQTGEAAVDPRYSRASLASLRASPYLRTVVAGMGFDFWRRTFSDTLRASRSVRATADEEPPFGAIYVMQRQGEGTDRWDIATTVIGPTLYHGIEILPDNDTLLVATADRVGGLYTAPYAIETYRLSEIVPIPVGPDRSGSHRFGPRRRQLLMPNAPIALMANAQGSRVYALTRAVYDANEQSEPRTMALHTIDPASLVELAPPIVLADWIGAIGEFVLPMMAIQPDGLRVVTTAGVQPKINVADLKLGIGRSIPIEDADAVSDVAFSYGPDNYGMLAVVVRKTLSRAERQQWPQAVGKTQVRVGTLTDDAFVVHGVSGWTYGISAYWPAAVDWTSGGLGLVAALDHVHGDPRDKQVQAALMSVSQGGARIDTVRELSPCDFPTWVMDVLTANGHVPTETPSPTASPSATLTDMPPLPSHTPTLAPSATASSTSPPPSEPPQAAPRAYLPFCGRWQCFSRQVRQDVVLVLDSSSSMADRTRLGRRKIDAARDAAMGYLALLQLEAGDRASVITFDVSARVVEALTDQRQALETALSDAKLGALTCIPCAIEAAANELARARRRPGNTPVIVLLTDGRSNPRPIGEAVALAAQAKDTGIVIYTIGLGDDLDADALAAMASRPTFFFHAPDAEDLTEIYRGIAVTQPCPDS